MDILVCIPEKEENLIRATKLNPISGSTDGYWTLSGCPKFTRPGDRIWFSICGEVVASAKIMNPHDEWEDEGGWGEWQPAVRFDIPGAMGHEFSTPREIPTNYRGFRYVRRAKKRVAAKYTQGLELVGAAIAEELFPRNW